MKTSRLGTETTRERAGGKARGLAQLLGFGFRVPPTQIIDRSAFGAFLETYGLVDKAQQLARSAPELSQTELVERHEAWSRDLSRAVGEAGLGDLLNDAVAAFETDGPIVVRSSALYEDGAEASFSGVFESAIVGQDPDGLAQGLLTCWSSALAPRALRYLARMGIDPRIDAMAVLLQPVLDATASGVIGTANPEDGNPWEFSLHAAPGLSVDLLAGSGSGDAWTLAWDDGSVRSERIREKPHAWRPVHTGVERVELSAEAASAPTLNADELRRIARAARGVDEHFGRRMDVEWVLADGRLWLVQARPLTALPEYFPVELDEEDAARTWNLAWFTVPGRPDLPPGRLTPFYADLCEDEMWYRYQPDDIVLTGIWREHRDVHGFRFIDPTPAPTFVDGLGDAAGFEPWLEKNEPRYRGRWEAYRTELDELTEIAKTGLADATSARGLIPSLRAVRDQLWDLNSFGWSGPQALGWMCEAVLREVVSQIDAEASSDPLVQGGADSYSSRVTRGLQTLGHEIDEPEVERAFEEQPLAKLLAYLEANHPSARFLRQYDEWCWAFGRTPRSWAGRPPFWRVSPDPAGPLHTVRAALRGESRDVEELQRETAQARDDAERHLREKADGEDDLMARLDRALDWTRFWTQALNDRHELGRVVVWERELMWHVGEHLVTDGILARPEDILLVPWEALLQFAAEGDYDRLKAEFETSRDLFDARLRLVPPPSIGAPPPEAAEPTAQTASGGSGGASDEEGTLKGTTYSRGVAEGEVRHVADLNAELFDSLQPHDVLILPTHDAFPYADWHSLLTLVCAVASPGHIAHHISQVARECGVPVLGDVTGGLESLEDGARVVVDASAGEIRVI